MDMLHFRFVLASRLQFPMLPFFGACGRATFIQGPTKPLSSFLDEPAIVRIDLGNKYLQFKQYHKFVSHFLSSFYFLDDIIS